MTKKEVREYEKKQCIALTAIYEELHKAEKKHPIWPDDKIHAVAIMVEEAGEAMKAAIDHTYRSEDILELRKELAQTGAMAIRCLMNLKHLEISKKGIRRMK